MSESDRRVFLKQAAGLGALAFLAPADRLFRKEKVGIQLYTVRSLMSADVEGTLKMIASLGYQEVESAGYSDRTFYGMSPSAFRAFLQKYDLTIPSGHYQTGITMPDQKGTMTNGWLNAVKDAVEVGQQYMALAYLHDSERKTMKDYENLIPIIRDCATICKDYGIQFVYHNHDFEFMEVDGVVPYEYILAETDSHLVKMELDLYWTVKAGRDPVEMFKENPGRYPLWHIKDMNDAGEFTEVGTGTINFKTIFRSAKKAGLTHFFVEQDQIKGDVRESITKSFNNIQDVI